jgi:hypothetical protein
MSPESTKLRKKNRFKHDKCAINMCYLLWNLVADNRSLGLRFLDLDNLNQPYDNVLLNKQIQNEF